MAVPKALVAALVLFRVLAQRRRPRLPLAERHAWIPAALSVAAIAAFAGMGMLAVANFSNFD